MARTTPQPRLIRHKPLPEPPETPLEVNFNDLPSKQLARIERLAGVSLLRWQQGESTADQLAATVAVLYDTDFDVVSEKSPRELLKYVSVVYDGEDDEDEEDGSGN